MQKEFVKECHKHSNTTPISSFVVQDWFREDLYALMNTNINPDQSLALANTFKYIEHNVSEICFANNNMSDSQFAELLTAIKDETKQYNNLSRITYGSNNELGC